MSDGPLETGVALGGISAIGLIAAYEMHWEIVTTVVGILGMYVGAKLYAARTPSPPT